jgi:glycosyltransferase involved in cell wall biosynthesis
VFEWSHRKGPDVLLQAWARAFKPGDDVCLVQRCYPRGHFSNDAALQRDTEAMVDTCLAGLGLARAAMAPIIVLARHLTSAQIPELMASADCYVAPSRGEGWGRPQQEAMATGKPVIATRWSGNLDFMNDDNSLLIDIEGLVTVDDRMDVPQYRGQRWAEPSVEHLSELFVTVAGDAELRHRLGVAARRDIEERWDWHHVAAIAAARLYEVGRILEPQGPPPGAGGAGQSALPNRAARRAAARSTVAAGRGSRAVR